MPDQAVQDPTNGSDQAEQQPASLATEIARALASVRARYVGEHPSSSEVDLEGGVVRWAHACGAGELDEGLAEGNSDREPGTPARTVAGYERETSAAVARATHRRVSARMSRHDEKTGIATETFVLENLTKRY